MPTSVQLDLSRTNYHDYNNNYKQIQRYITHFPLQNGRLVLKSKLKNKNKITKTTSKNLQCKSSLCKQNLIVLEETKFSLVISFTARNSSPKQNHVVDPVMLGQPSNAIAPPIHNRWIFSSSLIEGVTVGATRLTWR